MRVPDDGTGEEAGRHCWECCLAALLEVEPVEVPDLHRRARTDAPRGKWWAPTIVWLWSLGRTLAVRVPWAGPPDGPAIAVGASPRKERTTHAVVVRGDEMVYDPYTGDADGPGLCGVMVDPLGRPVAVQAWWELVDMDLPEEVRRAG